jgi:hypothetical protein
MLMKLNLGDWSNDGHGKTDTYIIDANISADLIKEGYIRSCKMTKVSFHDVHDRSLGLDPDTIPVCANYEEHGIPVKAIERLKEHGLDPDLILEDTSWISPDELAKLIMEFIKLSVPGLDYRIVDDLPNINGYWDSTLNVQFGYGLYE